MYRVLAEDQLHELAKDDPDKVREVCERLHELHDEDAAGVAERLEAKLRQPPATASTRS